MTFISCAVKTEPDSNDCAHCLLYYRLRTLEGLPDDGGSCKDATVGCANTQCAGANFHLVNGNLTAEQTKELFLSGLPSPPGQTKQENEFLWDNPQDAALR